MGADNSRTALQEELRKVEADLENLRRTAANLRQRLGERWDDPADALDKSALITAAEEQEALADELDSRRNKLLGRLGE